MAGARVDDEVEEGGEHRLGQVVESGLQLGQDFLGLEVEPGQCRTLAESLPMVAAALVPCPMTSPIARAALPSGRVMTSYQSPPTSVTSLAGR